MPDKLDLSEAKLALLEKYLRGNLPQPTKAAGTNTPPAQEGPASLALKDSGSPEVPVVPLQTSGSKRPFFYIHVHVEGGAFYCFTLAHHLGPDQPFYVLDPYRFDGKQTLTFEAMAAAYVESMRAVQPEGPYFLGGFCGGGLIAVEMAHQLRAAGQEVEFLLLIEAKDGPAPHRMRFRKLLGDFVRRIGDLLRLSQERQCNWYIFLEFASIYLRHVYDYLRIQYRRLENSLGLGNPEHSKHGRVGDKAGIVFPRPSSFGITGKYIGPRSEEWIGKFVWMISHYVTRQYPGKVTYLWASHTIEQEQLRFRRIEDGQVPEAEELETHIIPSNHTTIINEHIHDLAECLRSCLSEAQEAALSHQT
jgi:Thioesterase domain